MCLYYGFEKKIQKNCQGESYIIVYADDFICCFQYQKEAELFMNKLLPERLKKFKLEVAKDKTRLISFGRFAKERSKNGKVDTFDFLGFTHYCGKSKKGYFRVKRKTSKKKLNKSIKEFKIWIRNNRNLRATTIIKLLNIKLRGYYQYYGITDNGESLNKFLHVIKRTLWKWLNRRSQRRSYTSIEFAQLLKSYPLIRAKICVNIYDI